MLTPAEIAANTARRKPPMERFMSMVNKTDLCWLWTGAIATTGYGYFRFVGEKTIGSHRASWRLFRGPIPEGMFVCHHCDVRQCVNPEHLFLGLHEDNMADMSSKGRTRNGASRPDMSICLQGHHGPWKDYGEGKLRCVPCKIEKDRRYYARKTGKSAEVP